MRFVSLPGVGVGPGQCLWRRHRRPRAVHERRSRLPGLWPRPDRVRLRGPPPGRATHQPRRLVELRTAIFELGQGLASHDADYRRRLRSSGKRAAAAAGAGGTEPTGSPLRCPAARSPMTPADGPPQWRACHGEDRRPAPPGRRDRPPAITWTGGTTQNNPPRRHASSMAGAGSDVATAMQSNIGTAPLARRSAPPTE